MQRMDNVTPRLGLDPPAVFLSVNDLSASVDTYTYQYNLTSTRRGCC